MTDPVAACPDHGFFAGETCPACDRSGTPVFSGERRRRLSKYCSGALRHFPDDAGLTLDGAGWTTLSALVDAAEAQYEWADDRAVRALVATDPKGRFELSADGGRVRAAYGHSVAVELDADPTPVPDILYHGTAPDNRESIRADGLEPMGRQQVHLSGDVETARSVGRRHDPDPIVFAVDAAAMVADGHTVTRRGTGVFTTDRVPPQYLDER